MKWFISQDKLKSAFQDTLEKDCGQKAKRCYQCGKCSAGCPLAFEMDYLPSQIIRMLQLGMVKEVLASKTIWLCASCLTCTVRCPREVDLAEIMDTLRRLAYKKGLSPKEEAEIPLFNKVFLKNIEMFGRLFEMGLIGMYNVLSGEFLKDTSLAPKMFLKRKIGLLPAKVKNLKELREIFRRSGRGDRTKRGRLLYPKLIFLNACGKLLGKTKK